MLLGLFLHRNSSLFNCEVSITLGSVLWDSVDGVCCVLEVVTSAGEVA